MEEIRISKLEERMNKVEAELKQHSIDQAETRVYVKEIYKKLDDLKDSFATLSTKPEKDNDRWSKIVERFIWGGVAIVAYLTGNGGIGQ